MDKKYLGMTVNERLYVSGLLKRYDAAIKAENINEVISILKAVEITDNKAIKDILESYRLKNDK